MTRSQVAALVGIGVLTLTGLTVAQTPPAPPAAARPAAADAEEGRKLYTSYGCYQCHGYEAQGGVAGPRLGPGPLPLGAFRSYVRRPAGQMPLYSARLVSDAELGQIHAFLESLPAPPPLDTIPLLLQ